MIHRSEINIDKDMDFDEIFIKKYKKYYLGKINGYSTRISTDNIKPGFYRRINSEFQHDLGYLNQEEIEKVKIIIKAGARPTIHIYGNINKEDNEEFLCPDDVNVYMAYKELEIKKIPVLILGSSNNMEESGYIVRSIEYNQNTYTPHFHGCIPINATRIPVTTINKKITHDDALNELIILIKDTKKALKDFHQPINTALHYHHTQFSILKRAEDSLLSMRLLYQSKLYLNAAVLVRSLYELTLIFYADWISPEIFNKYLKLSSIIKEKEWLIECDKELKANMKKGMKKTEAEKLKNSHMSAFHLASTVSEKARIFPLGEDHHQQLYSFLSKIAHQDFSMTARYKDTFDEVSEEAYSQDIMNDAIFYTDIFISHIVNNILSDIGFKQ